MKTKYIFFLLALTFVLSSCEKTETEEIPTRTVFAYMVASNLGSYLNTNINHMIASASKENLNGGNLIVFYSSYNKSSQTISGELFQIKEGNGGVVTKHHIRDYDEQSAVDPAVMRGIIDDVFSEFPAKSYGMILSSHATAWLPQNYASMLRSFGEENGSYMEIPDLASALKGLPLDFIAFDACSMGAIECAYELKDCADYYISSTSEIMGTGFPFKEMLPYFFTDVVDYENIVRSFHNFYLASGTPYGSLSVVKTEGLDELTAVSQEILSAVGLEGVYALDLSDRQILSDLPSSPVKLYDFADIMLALATTDDQKNRFNEALNQVVIHKSVTDKIFFARNKGRLQVNSYSGLTVYPLRQSRTALNEWYHTNLSWPKAVY